MRNIKFKCLCVEDIFDVTPTKRSISNIDELLPGDVPVISNTLSDNGVLKYVNAIPLNKGGVITVSDTIGGAESMFYQKRDFIGYSHIQGLTPIDFVLSENIALYIITVIRLSTVNKYDYGTKFNRSEINKTSLTLPWNSRIDRPDYILMDKLGCILKKLVVQNLRKNLDIQLEDYKTLANTSKLTV